MRKLFCALAVAAALCAAPASAQQQQPQQQQTLTAEQEQVLERYLGPALDLSIELCVTEAAPDPASLETRWTAAGWPAFNDLHGWRVSNLPPGDRVLLSFGVMVEAVTDSTVPGTAITCSLLMPPIMRGVLARHIETRFATGDGMGFFLLQNGRLTERSIESLRGTSIGGLFAETSPDQRIVMLTTEESGPTVVARITVMHRTQ